MDTKSPSPTMQRYKNIPTLSLPPVKTQKMRQYLSTPEGKLIPLSSLLANGEQQSPTQKGDVNYEYLHNQQLIIPKDTDWGFVPYHNVGNNHAVLLRQLAKTSTLHRRCITTIAKLIEGNGLLITDYNGKPLTDAAVITVTEYLKSVGYTANHGQFALQLYAQAAMPVNIIEGNGAEGTNAARRRITNLVFRQYSEFRLGLPEYRNFAWKYDYHLYATDSQWASRTVKGSNVAVSPKLAKDKVISINSYNPSANYDHLKMYVLYPAWKAMAEERGSQLAHSYLVMGNIGFNAVYPSPEYEDLESIEAIQTPYQVAAFNHRTLREGLKSQYIVNVYSFNYAKDPESEDYQEQIKSHATEIRSRMIEQGNILINPLAIGHEAGIHAEGHMEIVPIPAPQNTSEYKQDILLNADERILIAHNIPAELVGLSRSGNSLANQSEYIMARYEMLNDMVIEPYQRIMEEFLNNILLTEQNGFPNTKVSIKQRPSIQALMLFADYLTIAEVRQELKRAEANPVQYEEILSRMSKSKQN